MNETQTTVRGTIITDPVTRRVGDDEVFTFRVASNTRYQDRNSGEWKTGGTLYFSANCWGKLAQRTAGRLFKGDAVLVHGRLLTNEYEREGRVQRDLEMRVSAIGPDMSRMDVSARRIRFDPVEPGAGGPRDGGETGADAMSIGSVSSDEVDGESSGDAEVDGLRGLDGTDSDLLGERSDMNELAVATPA
ncbi:single-stranded DNA-binding protein [Dietzia aurantiaca]|uniref:single-stranded DNA-binding protein n=1 Tax=Dietzia aurantiaca TaxID=983873 RepID=UPI001E53D520|nr:single-stranded DNA-binding protein [Dietzia aurantiaca]MCD2263721.1 single-stranded DNA-binding protein [Dietzia aurantiaca]